MTAISSPEVQAAATVVADAAATTMAAWMWSEPSERVILHCALVDDRKPLLGRLMALLASDDFHLDAHKVLWQAIRTLADSGLPHDTLSVLDYCSSRQLFVGGVEYLAALQDDVLAQAATEDAIDQAALRVKEFSTRRRLALLLRQGEALCKSDRPVGDLFSVIEDDMRNLRKLSESSRSGPEHLKKSLAKVLEQVERQMDGEPIQAIPTGFDDLDRLIYGFADGDLIILAARPSMGKTAKALNLARNIGTRHPDDSGFRKVLLFSTEMLDEALARRLVAREARINLGDLRRGELSGEDITRMSESLTVLEASGIYIDDTPGLTLHEIRARSRAFVAEHGKCLIVVDYLQNLAAPEGVEKKDHVGASSNGLKMLARELGVPVVALSQLNRGLEQRANKRPVMSDLRESGNIEQDADVIVFLYRDEVYNPDTKEPGICEVIVAKQRDGAVGTVKEGFDKATGLFYNLAGA